MPTTQTPASLISRNVRARLVTCTSGTVSAAPHATLRAVPLSFADLSLGTIIACTPAASALRKQAPKLCGSVMPSSTSKKGVSSRAMISSRSFSLYIRAAFTLAIMPWCCSPSALLSSALRCINCTEIPNLRAWSITGFKRLSSRPFKAYISKKRSGSFANIASTE